MSEPGGEDKKSHLSHALSLPLEENNQRAIRKQQSLRIKPVSKPVTEESPSPVPPPIKDRSWSFGNVAKVVGCGVTAFGSGVVQGTRVVGSGVVQGTKVVGSGVVQGTKAVGSGVVQGTMVVGSGVVSVGSGVIDVGTSVGTGVVHGTKMAGKVTKDVTIAAGKGVYTAGEYVGSAAVSGVSAVGTATVNAGMAVGEASASALNDTTKWVKEKRSRILQPGQEFDEYDILPGETLESVSEASGVEVETLILINELKSRNALSGKRILLPNAELKKSIMEMDENLPFTHCMDHVRIRALTMPQSSEEFVFFITKFYKQDDGNNTLIFTHDIESIEIALSPQEPVCPELLPADVLEGIDSSSSSSSSSEDDLEKEAGTCELINSEDKSSNQGMLLDVDMLPVSGCLDSSTKRDYKVTLTLSKSYYIYYINDENLFKLVKFLELWIPERLKMDEALKPIIDAKQFGIPIDDDSLTCLRLPTLLVPSRVLKEEHIRNIYKYLPPQNQNECWNLEYSTSTDGFSLKNLYRRLGAHARDPILLAVLDHSDAVFGVFLTTVPRQSEVFIGNGNSWLFSAHEGKKEDFMVYTWTGINDYFFKGDASHIMVGGGDGKFGLFLDSDLNKGRTDSCLTFNNAPLTDQDFTVKCLEAWSFI